MEPNQIALEMAKLALEKQQASILSDLIKVGIPSVIAIISGIITFKLSVNSQKSIEKITILKQNHEAELATNNFKNERLLVADERNHKMIVVISESLAEIVEALNLYTSNLLTKKSLIEKQLPENKLVNKKTIETYTRSSAALEEYSNKIISNSKLINEEGLVIKFCEYKNAITRVHANFSFETDKSFDEVIEMRKHLNGMLDELYFELSKAFSK